MTHDDLAARGVRVKALDEALADLRKAVEGGQPWHPRDFESFTPKRAQTVATILNAVVDGTLAPAALIREAVRWGFISAAPGEWRVSDIQRVAEAIEAALRGKGE